MATSQGTVPPDSQGTETPPPVTSATAPPEDEQRVAAQTHPPAVVDPQGKGASNASAGYCFRNRILFQPTVCSMVPEVLSRIFGYVDLAERQRVWRIAYAGGADVSLKLADIFDRLGHHRQGVVGVARRAGLYHITQKPFNEGHMSRSDILSNLKYANLGVCGACCECAARNEYDDPVAPLPYQMGALILGRPPPFINLSLYFSPNASIQHSSDPWSADEGVCPPTTARAIITSVLAAADPARKRSANPKFQAPTSSDPRGGEIGSALPETAGTAGGLDILSLEAAACDPVVVRETVISGMVRPMLLEYTSTIANNDAAYKKLVADLFEVGYDCYIFTIKPVSRRFRGQRPSAYPIAVLVSPPCWRPIWGALAGPSFHTMCHLRHPHSVNPVFKSLRRITHKGQQYGCFAADRIETWRELTMNLTSTVIERDNAKL